MLDRKPTDPESSIIVALYMLTDDQMFELTTKVRCIPHYLMLRNLWVRINTGSKYAKYFYIFMNKKPEFMIPDPYFIGELAKIMTDDQLRTSGALSIGNLNHWAIKELYGRATPELRKTDKFFQR